MFHRHVKIMAQVEGEWSFQIEAPSTEAYRCFADWISIASNTDDDSGQASPARPPRVVGFTHTPATDLGESEASTQRAGDDD